MKSLVNLIVLAIWVVMLSMMNAMFVMDGIPTALNLAIHMVNVIVMVVIYMVRMEIQIQAMNMHMIIVIFVL
jgi:hypothetical protein